MIRIYFDWNVFSNLKKEHFRVIKEYVDHNIESLLIPYSPAHFTDLMKSYSEDNKFFFQDLETLQRLCRTNLIRYEKDKTQGLKASPKEYFEKTKNDKLSADDFNFEKLFKELGTIGEDVGLPNMGELITKIFQLVPSGIEVNDQNKDALKKLFPNIKSNSSLWDLIVDMGPTMNNLLNDGTFYKDFRSSIAKEGFKLDSNSGQWNEEEVIKNIDEYLDKLGTGLTYMKYVEESLKHNKDGYSVYQFYTTAYLMLDMIGYKQDKLPKDSDNMGNIQADAEHSFYAAHCDYFICGDKILRTKSKILFKEFNLSTIVLSPNEFIETISKVAIPNIKENLISDIIDLIQPDNYITSRTDEEISGTEDYYKLPVFFLNYFNSMVVTKPDEESLTAIITLRRVFNNYADFVYYTEVEYVFDKMIEIIGYENSEELPEAKNQFVYEKDFDGIIWRFEGGMIHLEKDDNYRPALNIFMSNSKKNDD